MEAQDTCLISLLGGLRVTHGGRTQTQFPRRKVAALLGYLALHRGQMHPRDVLVEVFWPERDSASGRDNLSTTLSAVRRLLEGPGGRSGGLLLATHHEVGLAPAGLNTDVAEFERLLDQAGRAEEAPEREPLLARALALYEGDLLPGVYDDWAVREAERLRDRCVTALRRWSQDLERLGDMAGALRAAQRAVAAEPFSGEEQARVIALLARMGRPAAAREAYGAMESLWRAEFGAPPPLDTRLLVEALQPEGPAASKRRGGTARAPEGPSRLAMPPRPLDRFFGREPEMAELAAWWADPAQRLLTLTGPGGVGKTRTAVEFARRTVAAQAVPWHFASLADTSDPAHLLAAVAQALPLPPGPGPALERIAAFFGTGETAQATAGLLILDNLEQLLGDAGTAGTAKSVAGLLNAAPGLRCLCTSRRPLGLRGERLFPLDPLPVPLDRAGGVTDADALLACPSVALYTDRARAVRPDFRITPGSAGAVGGLCRLLEGSPLAVELAASWVRSLPPRAMWERLTQGAGLSLETRYADVPARQRSLRAALDWSWRLLQPDEQTLLASLSVFRGGWSREAAEAVCGEPEALGLLARLEEASLVRAREGADGETRWRFLETVRQYAQTRRDATGAGPDMEARHADFFAALAHRAAGRSDGPGQAHCFNTLEAEHDNLRAALDFFLEAARRQAEAAERGLRLAAALLPFWRAHGHLREGAERYTHLLAATHAAAPTTARAVALNGLGVLAMLQSDYTQADVAHREAREICRSLGDREEEATALQGLGNAAFYTRNFTAARAFYEGSLALREMSRDATAVAASCHCLGNLALREERLEEAAALFDRALELRRRAGDSLGVAATLGAISQLRSVRGDWDAATVATREALRLFDQAGQRWTGALSLELLSRAASAHGRPARSARLLAAAQAVRERFNFQHPQAERESHQERVEALRARMGEAEFLRAWGGGLVMTWEEALGYAMTDDD